MTVKTIVSLLGVALLGVPGPFETDVDFNNKKITKKW